MAEYIRGLTLGAKEQFYYDNNNNKIGIVPFTFYTYDSIKIGFEKNTKISVPVQSNNPIIETITNANESVEITAYIYETPASKADRDATQRLIFSLFGSIPQASVIINTASSVNSSYNRIASWGINNQIQKADTTIVNDTPLGILTDLYNIIKAPIALKITEQILNTIGYNYAVIVDKIGFTIEPPSNLIKVDFKLQKVEYNLLIEPIDPNKFT